MVYGLICEYNPFHDGHQYQLNQIREHALALGEPEPTIVCAMSGNFVQRGEPAIWNKWERTRAAIKGGAGLVLEIPTVFATAPAPDFARGGMALLMGTGMIDTLVYGVEDLTLGLMLPRLASLLHNQKEQYEHILHNLLRQNASESFARLRLRAMEALAQAEDPSLISLVKALDQPNLILGLEYELALLALSRDAEKCPQTLPIARSGQFAAASEIRAQMAKKPLPGMHFCNQYSDALNYSLTQHSFESLLNISGMNDALAHRLLDAARDYPSWDELLSRLSCKTWPTARLRRLLLYVLLGLTEESRAAQGFDKGPQAIKVLGTSNQTLISRLAKSATLPLSQEPSEYEAHYTDIYAASPQSGLQKGAEYTMPLIKGDRRAL